MNLGPWWRSLHLTALFGLAVIQPVLDLLGRNPAFFVAHGSSRADLLVLALLPTLLAAAVFLAIARLADVAGAAVGRWLHLALIALLAATLAQLGLQGWELGNASLAVALVLGIGAAIAYARYSPVRSLLSVLGVAPLVAAVVFLVQPGIWRLIAPRAAAVVADVRIGNPVPVVLVVWDEFSGLSLMDDREELDAARYPGFGELAQHSTWFRNATGVSFRSEVAVPSILTGRYPTRNAVQSYDEYPENVFTLLGGTYRIVAFESLTRLCPREVCRQVSTSSTAERIGQLFEDAAVTYGHLLLPTSLARAWLPPIRDRWGGFAGEAQATSTDLTAAPGWRRSRGAKEPKVPPIQSVLQMDRAELFERFLGSIEPSDEPTLYFLHIALPHTSLQYLPSGRRYTRSHASDLEGFRQNGGWSTDEWAVLQGTQRQLLQVGFVDHLLGRLMARLREVGLYDRALVIVTADHGVASVPGEPRRSPGATGYPELVLVPLLVKLPEQIAPAVSDRNVESIDIVPTIAHALSLRLPWAVDGASAFDDSTPPRDRKRFLTGFGADGAPEWRLLDPALPEKRERLRRQVELFGTGATRPNGLYAIGPYHDLVGHPVPEDAPEYAGLAFAPAAGPYAKVDLNGIVPARLRGSVSGGGEPPLDIAIGVNGTIAAVTRVTSRNGQFTAMIPDSALRQGKNDVALYLIRNEEGEPVLYRDGRSGPLPRKEGKF